jgi:hypothetical protein
VLDRHTILRGHLVRSQAGIGSVAQRAFVDGAIDQFRLMILDIERARTEPQQSRLDTAAFNRVLSEQIAMLEKVKIGVRSARA